MTSLLLDRPVAPRTRRMKNLSLPQMQHFFREGHPIWTAHRLEVDVPPPLTRAVACPIAPGSATIHHPKTLHFTGPNLTAVPRLAWAITFGYDHLS